MKTAVKEISNTIKCPQCETAIDVNDILYHQIEESLAKEYDSKNKNLESQKNELIKAKENIQEQIDNSVREKLNNEKIILEKTISDKVKSETSDQISILQKELNEKSTQLQELNKTKAEIERLKREKDELESSISLKKEQEFSNKLSEERLIIADQIKEDFNLKNKELEKKLEDQKKLIDEMRRKSEQGSMQLQGEIQELALEEILKTLFPFDIISEVGKGIKGADIIQGVKNKTGNDCGIILYESKRTKAFSNEWINKLKNDAIASKADICIIVTEALPEDIDKIGYKDGVWICSFNDIKGLVLVIRESLIKINDAYSSQTNKGEKMEMLYNYLTSNEFVLQIGAVVEGFHELQQGYVKEKNAMEKIWKTREKQLEKVLLNTNHFIGSIKGIAGNSMQTLKQISKDTPLDLVD